MNVPCQTKVRNLHGIIISNQNVSGRKITMNALSNEENRIKIKEKYNNLEHHRQTKTNATWSNLLFPLVAKRDRMG